MQELQSAVDDAADGDAIFILADTYTEQVTVTSIDDLTIVGEASPNDVTLNGQITVSGTLDGAFSVIGPNINAAGNNYGVNVTANSAGTGSVAPATIQAGDVRRDPPLRRWDDVPQLGALDLAEVAPDRPGTLRSSCPCRTPRSTPSADCTQARS